MNHSVDASAALPLLDVAATRTQGDEPMTIRTGMRADGWNNDNEALRIRTALKAGKIVLNHNESLKVRSTVKAGQAGENLNHNEALTIRSDVKAGHAGESMNHNEALAVRTTLKAGGESLNHNETMR